MAAPGLLDCRLQRYQKSWFFLTINVVVFAVWILVNQSDSALLFDPFPFNFLTMMISLESILLSIFVLIGQSRQADKDRVKADLDYQVNLKAELEIAMLLKQVSEVQNRVTLMQQEQERLRG